MVKLFSENKTYNLDFTVDHLIILDINFINAEVSFMDKSGNLLSILNKNNRIIKDINGDNIKVVSNQKELIYFYKRMANYSKKGTIVFDKSPKNKIMEVQ